MISHDDYYKHFPEMTDEEAAVYDFDSLDALDNDLFVEHLGALKAGKPVEIPSYDFATHARVEPYKSKANLVIPDGSDGLTFELVAQGILGLCGLQ